MTYLCFREPFLEFSESSKCSQLTSECSLVTMKKFSISPYLSPFFYFYGPELKFIWPDSSENLFLTIKLA